MLMGWFHASNQLNMESKLVAVATGDISVGSKAARFILNP
jgi:hypothetical protein